MKCLTFWRMPRQTKVMFLISFWLCIAAKLAIYGLPYKRLSAFFGRSCRMTAASTVVSQVQHQQACTIRRVIALAVRYTPWNVSCLAQALVGRFWCKYYGLPYVLFIGLAKEKSSSSSSVAKREAHAWVTTGPVAVTGGQAFETHHVIASYSNLGSCTS